MSSDDPLNSLDAPEAQRYQQHVSTIFGDVDVKPAYPTPRQKGGFRKAFVDLDESSDDLGGILAEQAETLEADMEDDFGTAEGVDGELLAEMDPDADGDVDAEGEDVDADELEEEDAQGDTDEELTIHLKPPEEQEEIQEEIADLEVAVPQLVVDYKVVDRLGTGTFSAVYKAIDLHYHDKWDNSVWHGVHPSGSSSYYQSAPRPPDTKVFVAIKRIYVTSGPERIKNEIMIMQDCRGCRHISQLITAFRHQDQVVAIMPFHKHEDFRVSPLSTRMYLSSHHVVQEYYRILSMDGIKEYFRCMFRAFRDIHARKIIHRDVKPANFLFDPRTGIGTLCDFGLACVSIVHLLYAPSMRSCTDISLTALPESSSNSGFLFPYWKLVGFSSWEDSACPGL